MKKLSREFQKIKKQQEYFENMQRNKKRNKRLKTRAKTQVKEYNKNNNYIYAFGVDNIVSLIPLHAKIDWFKYYLTLYFVEYLREKNTIRNNKI